MKILFEGTRSAIILAAIILSSCGTTNWVACPSFDTGKVPTGRKNKNGASPFTIRKTFPINIAGTSKHGKLSNPDSMDEQYAVSDTVELDVFTSTREVHSYNLFQSNFNLTEQNQHPVYDIKNTKPFKMKNIVENTFTQPHHNQLFEKKDTPNKNRETAIHDKSKRKVAVIKGSAIILMAILAGISIPVLGTATASIGLVAILLLDILISLVIIRYYKKEQPKLAKTTGFLRLLYSAIFGIGIGYHIAGDVAMFNKFWSLGLILFGLHLIALGILFNNEGGKKWVNYMIKTLLIVAGIGYTLLNTGLLFTSNPAAFTALIEPVFVVPQILGEVLFALWMLIKGGKSKTN
jgi:hypothetical protein